MACMHCGQFSNDCKCQEQCQEQWDFVNQFAKLQKETHEVSVAKGLEKDRDNKLYVPAKLALIMSEAVEALESHRAGKPEEIGHDLADIVIRTMDLAEALGIDLGKEILKKHEVNKTRAIKPSESRY